MAFQRDIDGFKTAIESVYADLRDSLLTGAIAPSAKMRVEELRTRYGVGSSTVREALSRLLVENLVTTEGQRGFKAAPVSLSDFRELVDMRCMIEVQGVRLAIERGDQDWESGVVVAPHRLARVEESIPAERAKHWEQANRDFHDATVAAHGNRWLADMRDLHQTHWMRYIQIAAPWRKMPIDSRAEHQDIFDAVISRKADDAAHLIDRHFRKHASAVEAGLGRK